MNERIKQLKQLATEVEHSHGAFGEHERHYRLNVDKFAELIVKECIKVLGVTAKEADQQNTYMGDDVPTVVHQIALALHFGVKP